MKIFKKHLIFALQKFPLQLFSYRKSAKKESGGGGGGGGEGFENRWPAKNQKRKSVGQIPRVIW
jgi:hypothetical protein